MTNSAQKRTNALLFLMIVVASAAIMLGLFWRYPLSTGIATLIVLAAFGISARLARLIDGQSMAELKRGK